MVRASFECLRAGLVAVLMSGAVAPRRCLALQERVLQVTQYTTDDGLAQNQVSGVVQDRTGFLWVATRRGLQRFDGHSFVSFHSLDPSAPVELSGWIKDVLIDRVGRLWVATPKMLFRADLVRRSILPVPLTSPFTGWAADSGGRLWLVDDGSLKWLDVEQQPALQTAGPPHALPDYGVLAASRTGEVWLARTGEVATEVTGYSLSTGTRRSFIADVGIPTAGLEDRRGGIWLSGTSGIAVLSPGADRFQSIEEFRGQQGTNFILDGDGRLLVATDSWLASLDSTGRRIEHWSPPEIFGVRALPWRLAVDREGGIWVATITRGIARLTTDRPIFDHWSSRSARPFPFASDFIMALREARDGSIWVGTLGGGAYRITADGRRTEQFRHIPGDPNALPSDEIWDFSEDIEGNLWIGATGGLCRRLASGFRCDRPPGPAGPGWAVLDIERDGAGRLWLAHSERGVIGFDPATGRFGPPIPTPNVPSSEAPVTLFVDRERGQLWFGRYALFRAPIRAAGAGSASVVRPQGQAMVYQLARDHTGSLWMGSEDGLFKWDSSATAFLPVALPELRGTTVYSIAEDRAGRLWLGTAHGLVRYSARDATARRYSVRDGFLSGELNRRAATLRRDGSLLFGGIHGLTRFDPDAVVAPRTAAPVVLTRWRKTTGDGPVESFLHGGEKLRLEPGDRAFTVEFTALSFAPALSRRYRYRLEGLSEDWIETTDRVATFGAPKPGHYTFRVLTAAGSEGEWSKDGAAIGLEVIPPFWLTSWFRGLLVLLAAALVWTAHRLRLRQALATERLRLRISRDLHDELGAGLSSIALLSDSAGSGLQRLQVSDEARSELRRIGESARGMVDDLRDIVWAIDPEADQLSDVVARMRDATAALLPEVRVRFDAPAEDLSGRIGMSARRDLLLLYKELLHNIARHARASEVRIELVARGDAIELTVADNGVGFRPNGQRSGTGLKSLRERTARLGGTLDLQSEPGHGTTVRVSLRRT